MRNRRTAGMRTTDAKMTHVKKLAIQQNERLRTVLGAYEATPTAVLEAEASISNWQRSNFTRSSGA